MTIRLLLTNPGLIKGRLLLVAFKELRKYLNNEFIDMPADVMYESHVAPYVIAPLFDCMANKENNAMVWAIPGLSSYFLSDELLLTEDMKMPLNEGLPPPEGERCFETEEECRRHIIRTRSTSSKCFQLSPSYCDFVKLFLIYTAYNESESAQELAVVLTPLTVALVKQAFKFWLCRYSRISFPAIKRDRKYKYCPNRAEFIFAYMFVASKIIIANRYGVGYPLKSNELAHGVTIHQFLSTIINDVAFYCCLSEDSTNNLFNGILSIKLYIDKKTGLPLGPWASLSPAERVDLLKLASKWNPSVPRHCDKIIYDIRNLVIILVATGSSKIILQLNRELDEDPAKQDQIQALNSRLESINFDDHNAVNEAFKEATAGSNGFTNAFMLMRHTKERLLNDALPLVIAYVKCIEPRYQQRAQASGMRALPFPVEIYYMIAEYALPDLIPFMVVEPLKAYAT